jgi:hypothetical protein
MGFKHRAKQVLGAVMVLASVGLSLLILRRLGFGQNAGIWQAGMLPMLYTLGFLILNACFALYLFYSGLRMVNPNTVGSTRFGWGKIIVGALILYIQVGFSYHLVPEGPLPIHMPSTPAEATSVVLCDLIAVYLIVRGIWEGYSRRGPQPDKLPPQSPESNQ